MTLTVSEHDAITNETIVRELTASEVEKLNAEIEAREAAKQERESAKAAAKQSVLDKLGLTEEELKAALA